MFCSLFTAVFGSSSLSCVSASFNSVFFSSGDVFWIVPKLVFSSSLLLLSLVGKGCVTLLSPGYIWLQLVFPGPFYYLMREIMFLHQTESLSYRRMYHYHS